MILKKWRDNNGLVYINYIPIDIVGLSLIYISIIIINY